MRNGIIMVLLLVGGVAQGASLNSQLLAGNDLLQTGQAAEALEAFNALQVEYPDAAAVQFGIGASYYQMAEHHASQGAVEESVAAFKEAEQHFDRLSHSDTASIQRHGAFNRANCLAQTAKLSAEQPELAQAAVGQFKAAIEAYEQVVDAYPDHGQAQQNLDHVRYALKVLEQQLEEQKQEQDEEQKEDQQPPEQAFVMLQRATTDINNADARPNEAGDTVQLYYGEGGQK